MATCDINVVTNALAIQQTGPRTVIVPADPIVWSESTSYEYLTLVTTEDYGRGYVSKRDVPSGTPITDTDYWIPVADYNAQMKDIQQTVAEINAKLENYQTQIDNNATAIESEATRAKAAESALQTKVDAIGKFHKLVYIGDSWGNGFYSGANHVNDGLAQQIANALGITEVVNLAVSGSGFYQGDSGGAGNFAGQIYGADDSEVGDADLVVVCGGQNDNSQGAVNGVAAATNQLMNGIATKCPNAEVHFFVCPLSQGRTFATDGDDIALDNPYLLRCMQRVHATLLNTPNRIVAHQGCHRWGWALGAQSASYIDDKYHLTAAGYKELAYRMATLITNGGDWWPMLVGNVSGYTGHGNVTRDRVMEINGTIYIQMAIELTSENPVNTEWTLPWWAAPSNTKFVTGISNAGQTTTFFSLTNDNITKRCKLNLEGQGAPANSWLFFSISYPAGI